VRCSHNRLRPRRPVKVCSRSTPTATPYALPCHLGRATDNGQAPRQTAPCPRRCCCCSLPPLTPAAAWGRSVRSAWAVCLAQRTCRRGSARHGRVRVGAMQRCARVERAPDREYASVPVMADFAARSVGRGLRFKRSYAHAHGHLRTHAHRRTLSRTHKELRHACTHARTNAGACAHTHARTLAQARRRTHRLLRRWAAHSWPLAQHHEAMHAGLHAGVHAPAMLLRPGAALGGCRRERRITYL
jgi:hypothetical protein